MTSSPIPTNLLADRLPDWWRPLAVDLGGRVNERRLAIEEIADELELEGVVYAVGYALGISASGGPLIDDIRAAARKQDPGFVGDVADIEPAAMTAAALAHHLAKYPESRVSTVASLLIAAGGWRKHKSVIDGQRLAEYSSLQLSFVSGRYREAQSFKYVKSARDLVAAALQDTQPLTENSMQLGEPELAPHLAAHAKALDSLASRVDSLARGAASESRAAREQLRLQTWLLEDVSRSCSVPWTEVEKSAVPVIAGAELVPLTVAVAPVPDWRILLASSLAKAGVDPSAKFDPVECVRLAAPNMVLPAVPAAAESLLPVSTALLSAVAGSAVTAIRKVIGPTKRSALDIAEQVYAEALAIRGISSE